jgi:hypothetical protein
LKYIGLFLLVLTALFLLVCNNAIAGMVASFIPTAYVWVFAALVFIEVIAFYWFWRGLFGRQDHLAFDVTDPQAQERLKNELVARLRENEHITKANLNPESVENCLTLLDQKADEEIQRTAKGIFLATALSQNGRIDAIIVFVGLCRMVWNISSIYNQKPHPSELVRLYWAITIPTFLAYSIEELNIASEVSASFGKLLEAVTPATVTGAIPFVGTALQRFTASAIDGAANCFLALRTGIITRNAYTYILTAEARPNRTKVFSEAGGMLSSICRDPIKGLIEATKATTVGFGTNVIDKLHEKIDKAQEYSKAVTDRTMEAVTDIKSGIGGLLTTSASTLEIETGIKDDVKKLVENTEKLDTMLVSVKSKADTIASTVKNIIPSVPEGLSDTAQSAFAKAKGGAEKVATNLGNVATAATTAIGGIYKK